MSRVPSRSVPGSGLPSHPGPGPALGQGVRGEPEAILLDATQWTGSQLPNNSFPVSTSVDIENGWIFQSFYGGFSIWDARTDPENPTRVSQVGGFEGLIPGWKPTGE